MNKDSFESKEQRVHFLNFFYFRRAQRDSAEKTSKFGLDELVAWDENNILLDG